MLCKVKNLSLYKPVKKDFDSNRVEILSEINLSIRKNSFHVIIGESGSGKTSLLKCIAGFEDSFTGEISFDNEIISRNENVQMLFQNNGELLNPLRKVYSLLKDITRNRDTKISSALTRFNFNDDILSKRGFELSGGEHQRVALMRILLSGPKLLLLDEPFASQDIDSNKIILNNLLKENSENGTTILCVLHNLNLLSGIAYEISVLHEGRLIESGTKSEIFSNPKNEFTKLFLESMKYNLTLQKQIPT